MVTAFISGLLRRARSLILYQMYTTVRRTSRKNRTFYWYTYDFLESGIDVTGMRPRIPLSKKKSNFSSQKKCIKKKKKLQKTLIFGIFSFITCLCNKIEPWKLITTLILVPCNWWRKKEEKFFSSFFNMHENVKKYSMSLALSVITFLCFNGYRQNW